MTLFSFRGKDHILRLKESLRTQLKTQDTEGPETTLARNHCSASCFEITLGVGGGRVWWGGVGWGGLGVVHVPKL